MCVKPYTCKCDNHVYLNLQMLPTNRLRLEHNLFSESALCVKVKNAIELRRTVEELEAEEAAGKTLPLDLPQEFDFPCKFFRKI